MSTTTETKISVADLRPGMTVRITGITDRVPHWESRTRLDPERIDYMTPERVAVLIDEYHAKWHTTCYLQLGQVKRSGEVVTITGIDFNVWPEKVTGRRETPQATITLADGRKFRSSTRQRVVLVEAA